MDEHPHEYDPERDGELLTAGDVCALLGVGRSHLPNLRKNGTLAGFQLFQGGHWRYPSRQPVLAAARAALHAAPSRAAASRRRQPTAAERRGRAS